ncbi:MAG: hypothetical protein ACLSE8_02655 [Parasutterella sp.]
MSASTDQNVPMSLGIPSTSLGGGGREASTIHCLNGLNQCVPTKDLNLCLLTALGVWLGLENGADPMLPIYTAVPRAQWQDRL